MRTESVTSNEGANLENRIDEMEVRMHIAEARAMIATDLLRFLVDQLSLSGVINWTASDLIREFLETENFDGSASKIARMDLFEGVDGSAEDIIEDMNLRRRAREKELDLLKGQVRAHAATRRDK